MNEKKLKNAGIDCFSGVRRFAGSAELYEKYLKKFIDDQNLSFAKKAMAERNYEDVLKYIHTLKGITGNLSMTELYNSCGELVTRLRNNEFNNLDVNFEKICLLYSKACESILVEAEN